MISKAVWLRVPILVCAFAIAVFVCVLCRMSCVQVHGMFWSGPMGYHYTADYRPGMNTIAFSVAHVCARTQMKDLSVFSSSFFEWLPSKHGI